MVWNYRRLTIIQLPKSLYYTAAVEILHVFDMLQDIVIKQNPGCSVELILRILNHILHILIFQHYVSFLLLCLTFQTISNPKTCFKEGEKNELL